MDISNYIIVAMLLLLVGAVIFGVMQSKARDEWMERAAQRHGGTVRKGGFLTRAELQIPYKDETIIIHMQPGSKHSSPKTVAIANVKLPQLPTLRLVHNGLWQKMLETFGKERVTTGDEDFDNEWVIRSTDEFAARKLAGADLKVNFSDRIFRNLDLKLEPKQMNMTALAIPSNEDQFNLFIDTAILVLQKFL
jgi:hypothetical protein